MSNEHTELAMFLRSMADNMESGSVKLLNNIFAPRAARLRRAAELLDEMQTREDLLKDYQAALNESCQPATARVWSDVPGDAP